MNSSRQIIMPDFCRRHHRLHFITALRLLRRLGLDLNRVEIIAVGEDENYKGEIREQEPHPGEVITDQTRIVLKIGFPGGVDLVPYQFFYGLKGVTARTDDWENRARTLMAPFDAAHIRRLVQIAHEKLKLDFSFLEPSQIRDFLQLFDFDPPGEDDLEESLIWMILMPRFYRWAGNGDQVAEVLQVLFGFDFSIEENVTRRFEIPDRLRYRLGSPVDRLGKGAFLGTSFCESDSGFRVIIKNVPREKIPELLPDRPLRRKIEKTLELCLPTNLAYDIKIFMARDEVGKAAKGKPMYLGYSSHV